MKNNDNRNMRFRSQDWFANPDHIDMTALYLERFMNYGITPQELRSGRPIIGIAQSGSDLSPCNRVHLELARRVRDGIRDAGGIPMEFPLHPIFENCRRPFQIAAPEPTSSPSNQPSSIGPPDNTIAGMSTVDAAMSWAGVVLSQPVVSTTASIG